MPKNCKNRSGGFLLQKSNPMVTGLVTVGQNPFLFNKNHMDWTKNFWILFGDLDWCMFHWTEMDFFDLDLSIWLWIRMHSYGFIHMDWILLDYLELVVIFLYG